MLLDQQKYQADNGVHIFLLTIKRKCWNFRDIILHNVRLNHPHNI